MRKLTLIPKKWLLSLHIIFSAIWLGITFAFLILSINVLFTDDVQIIKSYYTSLIRLETTAGRVSIIGTVATGIVLSVFTHWGMFKYRWIIVKEVLTIGSMGLGFAFIYFWTSKGSAILLADGIAPAFVNIQVQLLAGIVIQILSLSSMFLISVFKPWGKRKVNP